MKSIILFLLMASPAMAFDVTGNLPTALGDGRYVLKTGDTMSGPLTLAGSSLTVTGSAFSVGGSTFVVSGGKLGIGTTAPASKLHLSTGTFIADGSSSIFLYSDGTANTGGKKTFATGSGNIYYGHGETYFGNTAYANPFTTSINNNTFTRNSNDLINASFIAYNGIANAKYGGWLTLVVSTDNTSSVIDITAASASPNGQDSDVPMVVINGNQKSGATSGSVSGTDIIFRVANNQVPLVNVTGSGGLGSYSRTLAQLQAITPFGVGEMYFCNNCTPAKMVVSTGTAAGNFADIMGGTFQ